MPSGYFFEALGKFIFHVITEIVRANTNREFSQGLPPNASIFIPGIYDFEYIALITALKTQHGKYLSAEDEAHGWRVVADRTEIHSWETFSIIHVDEGHVALRTTHGTYLSAQPDGSVIADRRERGTWETFSLERCANKKVAFRSWHKLLLSAQPDSSVVADRQELGTWELFTLEEVTGPSLTSTSQEISIAPVGSLAISIPN